MKSLDIPNGSNEDSKPELQERTARDVPPASTPAPTAFSAANLPPDGGLTAWTQVAGAFFLFFNTWGVTAMFGVFQTYYQTALLQSQSPSNISWIGSTQGFLLLFVGAITGPFFDLGYLRTLLVTGTVLSVFGMMMTSICKEYWQFFLAQGIVTGAGFGCLFLPSIAVVSQYFTTKRSTAFGIAASGSSIGGVLYPIMFRQMEPSIGFSWTTRVIAFIMLSTMSIPLFGMRMRTIPPPSAKRRAFLDLEAFRSLPFLMFCAASFFGFAAIYVTFFYIQLYGLEKTDISPNLASYLLCVINATSTLGRLLPNMIADKTGPLNIQIPFAIASAVLCFGWIGIESSAGLLVFCCLYGFFSGSFVSLPGTTVVTLSPNLSRIGIQLGMSFSIAGAGLLIGEPIAGAILRGRGGWLGLQVFVAALLVASAICSLAARFFKVGLAIGVKV